jgi:hypothetical protein
MSDVETPSTLQPAGQSDSQRVRSSIRASLEQAYGPLLKGEGLANALGYKNLASLRQAKKRNQVGVPLFELPNRKGLYALTTEVADWLAMCRLQLRQTSDAPSKETTMP